MKEDHSKRPRSEKDVVPKFSDGESALDWMEKKLDGSWTDQVDEKPEVDETERAVLLDSETMSIDDFNKLMGF